MRRITKEIVYKNRRIILSKPCGEREQIAVFTCPPSIDIIADMDMLIIAWGEAKVTCDEKTVYDQPLDAQSWDEYWTVKDAEDVAKKEPHRVWKIIINGALQGKTYQRMSACKWLLVDENDGFA